MPKKLLSGTLDEQCAFLYDLAQQKMAAGNYTGALHALKEIVKYKPDYPGAAALLAQAQQGKREVTVLLWFSFAGAIVAVFFGTLAALPNDFWFLGLAVAGAVAGFLLGSVMTGGRRAGRRARGQEAAKPEPMQDPGEPR